MKISTIIITVFLVFNSQVKILSQNNSGLIKTIETTSNNLKRREIFYDSNMTIVKENYFQNDIYDISENKLICSIEYENNNLFRITGFNQSGQVVLLFDKKKGKFYNAYTNTEISFDKNQNFEGVQRNSKIVVKYKSGTKNGLVVQTDSAISGTKNVMIKKVDPEYLGFNIIKFYNSIDEEPVYKLFKGIKLNFTNNKLDGKQESSFLNGKTRFDAFYKNGKLLSFASFDEESNFKTKIQVDSFGISNKPAILNGVLLPFDTNFIFYQPALEDVGNISRKPFPFGTLMNDKYELNNYIKSSKDFFENGDAAILKKIFDNNKMIFNYAENYFALFKIPNYLISEFDYELSESKFTIPISVNKMLQIDSNGYYYNSQKINPIEGFYDGTNLFHFKNLHFGYNDYFGGPYERKTCIYESYNIDKLNFNDFESLNFRVKKWLANIFKFNIK